MVIEITNKDTWNGFVLSLSPNTFLQSWEWGETQKATGEQIKRLGVFEGDKQIGVALVVIVKARRGRHYLIPHGPLFVPTADYGTGLVEVIKYLRAQAGQDNVAAIRVAPLVTVSPANLELFSSLGFRPAPLHVHAELTWVLNISRSLDEIKSSMRKTTRHAIGRADRLGIVTEVCLGSEIVERFMPLYEATTQRHGFIPFSREFITKQVEAFSESNNVFGVFGKYENKDVAAGIYIQFGQTVFYYHGASRPLAGNIPVAHAVQWTAIQEAKRRGATRYNFWGIAPKDSPNHPFAGITIFKQGFGGEAINYFHAQDLPLSWRYWWLWGVEMARKIKRGF